MEEARNERLKAYGLLVLFVLVTLGYGWEIAHTMGKGLGAVAPEGPLIIGAMIVSLGTILPLVTTFKPSEAAKLLERMRDKARRAGKNKNVTKKTAARAMSLYTVALAGTPMMYGLALVFLAGQFSAMLLLLPATAILAAVGWFVLGRLMQEMSTLFLR